jgi:Domain of unknown function (DUF4442)
MQDHSTTSPGAPPSPQPSPGASAAFLRLIRSPIRFRLYLLTKLPSAFFSGLRIRQIDETQSIVTVPYKWFTRNPFRSTYFACLGMAAEMSTGVLAMSHIYQKPVSMLVVGMEATFSKKATGITSFHCPDGQAIGQTITLAISTGEGQTIKVRSLGVNAAGESVAEFFITWSFKIKKSGKKITQ